MILRVILDPKICIYISCSEYLISRPYGQCRRAARESLSLGEAVAGVVAEVEKEEEEAEAEEEAVVVAVVMQMV